MKEIFEEYGGAILLAIVGLIVLSGFVALIIWMKSEGLF